jgi:chromosomal replication initiator protein
MGSAVSAGDDALSSDLWSLCLASFQQELPAQQFNAWIKCLRLETAGPGCFRVLAPNRFILQWVRERYLARIEGLLRQFDPTTQNLTLALDESKASARPEPPVCEPLVIKEPTSPETLPPARNSDPAYEKARLNPDFSFETLVTGRSNDLARAAAQQVALNPGTSYNPLFVYGGVGLGKTHLVHALGNEVWRQNPDKVIRYVHTHDYIADVVRAYQQKAFDAFKRYYCSLDLLIIDDIQFISGKDRTQEEFFFAFNALIEAKKQIVITCDTYPKDIQGLENRLISRFDWGLTVQVEPPELEMRVAILKKKAEAEAVPLPDNVALFIAGKIKSNIRELEGSLIRLIAYASLTARDLTVALAQEVLAGVLDHDPRSVTIEVIQKHIADYYQLKVTELKSRNNAKSVAMPRQVAMYLCKLLTPASLPEIGRSFGGKHHSTVIHSIRKVEELRKVDRDFHNLLTSFTEALR